MSIEQNWTDVEVIQQSHDILEPISSTLYHHNCIFFTRSTTATCDIRYIIPLPNVSLLCVYKTGQQIKSSKASLKGVWQQSGSTAGNMKCICILHLALQSLT